MNKGVHHSNGLNDWVSNERMVCWTEKITAAQSRCQSQREKSLSLEVDRIAQLSDQRIELRFGHA